MAQVFCPQCGTSMPPGQRFCSNCGSTLDSGFSIPTAAASGDHFPPVPDMSAPPPPPSSVYNVTQPPATNTYYPPQEQQGFSSGQNFPQAQQNFQAAAAPQPVPTYAKPQKDSTKSVLGQLGCGMLVVILLIVGVCGGASYFAYRWVTSAASSTNTTNTTTNTLTGNNGNNSNSGTPQAIPTVTAPINQTLTFSSVDYTIVNAQEASSYSDDSSPSSPVIVRINVTEHNGTTNTVYTNYTDQLRLILPDKTVVTPSNSQTPGAISQSVQRNNWIDFPLSKSYAINQLTLQFGTASETQMNVPLTGNADLSQYKLKTITPNSQFQYSGVNWTITTITSSLSADGKQADTGMRFIVLTLKGDNNSANTYYPNIDVIRLKSGSITNSSTSNTLPVINAGDTGKVATLTFMMPQNNSSFTYLWLAIPNSNPPVTQASVDFQI